MTRGTLLVRRSAAHRGLLALVVLLVAAVAATLGMTLGSVQAAAVDGARQSVASADPAENSLVVTTRVAVDDPGAAESQDQRLRAVVGELLPGVPLDVAREEVPDPVDADAPFARWTITPDADRLGPDDLSVLASEAERVHPVLREDDAVAVRGLVVEGELAQTAAAAHEALSAASAVTLVPVVLLALIALVALVQVARLLAATREPEVGLLVSRGGSPTQVTLAAVFEAVVLALVAGAVGTAAAVAALGLRGASSVGPTVPVTVGLGVALVAVAVLGIVSGLQVRAAARRQVTDRSGRARQAAALGTVVLTFALAAVCLLQLRRYGSPLVVTPDGVRTDPLGAVAPALVLAALAVAAMAVLGPVTRGWAALAARGSGATAVLAARQVARRLVVFVVPVVLLVLAAGTATLAGTYAATSEQLRSDVAELRNGADVRVVLPPEGPLGIEHPSPVAAQYAALDGAAVAVPVLTAGATADSAPVAVVGVASESLVDVVSASDGAVDVEALASALAPEPLPDAPAIPAGSAGLTLRVSGSAAVAKPLPGQPVMEISRDAVIAAEEAGGVDLRLWLAASDGALTLVDAGRFDYDLDGDGDGVHPLGRQKREHDIQIPLPGSTGDWHLVGADFLLEGPEIPVDVGLTVEEITADAPDGPHTVDVGAATWSLATETQTFTDDFSGPDDVISVIAPSRQSSAARVRLVAGDGAPAPVPTAVTSPLAEEFGLAVGDPFELTLGSTTVPFTVATVVDVIPGELQRFAVAADLHALDATLLRTVRELPRPEQVWVAAEDPAAVDALARSAAGVAGDGATVTTSAPEPHDVDAAAPVRSTFALAAGGATVLALVGVAAVAVAMVRARRHEVVVLRAVGVPPRRQGRGRGIELVVVGGFAVLVGLAAGVLVARLVVGGLVRATLTGVAAAPDVGLRVDVWGVAIPVLALAAGLALTALLVGARVAAQARDTEYREEVR